MTRGTHEGSIFRRGDSWTYRFTKGTRDERHTYSKGGYPTQRAARLALSDALDEWRTNGPTMRRDLTFADYLTDEWLPIIDQAQKHTTAIGYRLQVEKHIVPELGPILLTHLTAGDITRFYGKLRAIEDGLSETSILQIHAVLSSALEHAVEARLLGRNPARQIPKKVRPRPARHEMTTWDATQLRTFLATVDGQHPWCALFTLAATTGMRRSELCGLKWADIDWAAGRVAVRRGRTSAAGNVAETTPKSDRARVVDIGTGTVALLRRHRARQLEDRVACAEFWTDLDYLFTDRGGNPIAPASVTRTFTRRVEAAPVPRVRFHDLRHTHASLLLAAGVHPKVVQERLGHASVAMTLDVYGHTTQAMGEAAAGEIDGAVFG